MCLDLIQIRFPGTALEKFDCLFPCLALPHIPCADGRYQRAQCPNQDMELDTCHYNQAELLLCIKRKISLVFLIFVTHYIVLDSYLGELILIGFELLDYFMEVL